MGEDCSFLVAFAAAPRSSGAPSTLVAWLLPLAVTVALVMMMDGVRGGNSTFGAAGTLPMASGSQACPDGGSGTDNGVPGTSEFSSSSAGREEAHVTRSATSVNRNNSRSRHDGSEGGISTLLAAPAAAQRPLRISNTEEAVALTQTPSSREETVTAATAAVAVVAGAASTGAGGGSSAHCAAGRRWKKTTRQEERDRGRRERWWWYRK